MSANDSHSIETHPLVLAALQCIGGIFLLVLLAVITASAAPQKKVSVAKPAARQSTSRTKSIKAKSTLVKEPELRLEKLPPDPQVENADVAITAHVRARSLKFDAVPNATVVFSGQPDRDTVWEATRENLPTPVQPGVTYRNIGIRLKITSVFKDIDRIVAEALGEVPTKTESAQLAEPSPKPVATARATTATRAATQPPKRGRH